jgi:hypothetical protein
VALNEYFWGGQASKICDKRDTPTPLGSAEKEHSVISVLGCSPVLSIVYAPSEAPRTIFSVVAPEVWPSSVRYTHMNIGSRFRDLDELFDDRREIFSFVASSGAAECSGYVFVDGPSGPNKLT